MTALLLASCGNDATVREVCDSLDTAVLMTSDGNFKSMQEELDTLRARNARMEQELDECYTGLDDAGYNFYQIGRYLDSAMTALNKNDVAEAKAILKEAKSYWGNPIGDR